SRVAYQSRVLNVGLDESRKVGVQKCTLEKSRNQWRALQACVEHSQVASVAGAAGQGGDGREDDCIMEDVVQRWVGLYELVKAVTLVQKGILDVRKLHIQQ